MDGVIVKPAADRRIPAHFKAIASVLDLSFSSVRCCRCKHRTCGRLYHDGQGGKVCAGCKPSVEAKLGTLRRAR